MLTSPLTLDEIRKLMDADGNLTVEVAVSLDELIDNDLEGLLDILCDKVGTGLLTDISYSLKGRVDDYTALIEVTGNAADALAMEDYENGE